MTARSEALVRRLPRRLFRDRPEPDADGLDPSAFLDPVLIMAGLEPGRRRRLSDEIDRKRMTPGPCVICGVPTRGMRPFVILPPDARLFGMPPDGCLIATSYFCPVHDTIEDARDHRAAMVEGARRRERDGLGPEPRNGGI
jgi:hypothetical protein